jgi:hypothetical protein
VTPLLAAAADDDDWLTLISLLSIVVVVVVVATVATVAVGGLGVKHLRQMFFDAHIQVPSLHVAHCQSPTGGGVFYITVLAISVCCVVVVVTVGLSFDYSVIGVAATTATGATARGVPHLRQTVLDAHIL